MTLRKGLPAKLALTDANDTRYDFNNNVVGGTTGVPRGGVTSPVGATIVSATATMNVSVAAFAGVAIRDGGAILLANDGATNVLLAAAPGANSRIDVITARQNDASSTVTVPDANNNALFVVIQGTASASPAKPAVPAGSLELATVQVPSTATATNSAGVVITQTAQFTAAPGGIVPVATKALLTAWTTASLNQRASVYADSTPGNNGDYVSNGAGAWTLVSTLGRVAFTPTISNFTKGTSVYTGWYEVHNGWCTGFLLITLNTGWFISGGAPYFAPPVPMAFPTDGGRVGEGNYHRVGTGDFNALFNADPSGNIKLGVPGGNGVFWGAVTATSPASWQNGDTFTVNFSYPI